MKKTKQITVDDRTYTVTQYMATRGQKLFIKLGKTFGKSIAMIFDQRQAGSILDLEVSSIIAGLFQNIDPESGVELIQEI
ncbi:MAG TPA: hypothetical protein DF383_10510, partial [Deltaproteobacteria bacterium]|nr:hypothetical protein [Deltaproteobacteria bacterium]